MDNDSKLIFENYLNHLKVKNNVLNEALGAAASVVSTMAPIMQALFGVSTVGGLIALLKSSLTGAKSDELQSIIQEIQAISAEGDYESEFGKIKNLSQSLIVSENSSLKNMGSVLNNVLDSYSAIIDDESIDTVAELDNKINSILIEASDEISSIISNTIKNVMASPQYGNADKARIKESGESLLQEIKAFTAGVQSGTYPVGRGARQGVIYDPQGNPIAFPDVSVSGSPPPEPDDEDSKKEIEKNKAKISEEKAKQEKIATSIKRAEKNIKQSEARLVKNKNDAQAKSDLAKAERDIQRFKDEMEISRQAVRKATADADAAASRANILKTQEKTGKLDLKTKIKEVKGPLWRRIIGWIWKIGLGAVIVVVGYDFMNHRETKADRSGSQGGGSQPRPTPTPTPTPATASGQSLNVTDAISQINDIIQGR